MRDAPRSNMHIEYNIIPSRKCNNIIIHYIIMSSVFRLNMIQYTIDKKKDKWI